MRKPVKVILLVVLYLLAHTTPSPANPVSKITGFKVTVLSTQDHATYFFKACQILFESTVHKAFEASCSIRQLAHRPFQAQPRAKAHALLINDTFFYDCELVGAWTGSDPHTGAYFGNRIWHCGGVLPNKGGE